MFSLDMCAQMVFNFVEEGLLILLHCLKGFVELSILVDEVEVVLETA